jgi:hypothetical protein
MGVTRLIPPSPTSKPVSPSSIRYARSSQVGVLLNFTSLYSHHHSSTSDLKAYLQTLLQSHHHTTLLLLRALAHPPPPPPPEFTSQEQFDAYNAAHGATVAQPYVARLAEIDVNMMVAVNGLRGEQGEMTVEGMMRAQVERRREETRGVRKSVLFLLSNGGSG